MSTYFQQWLEETKKPKSLLLIDDSLDDCQLMLSMSEDFNVKWHVAHSIADAELKLEEYKYHLVVLDLYIQNEYDSVALFRRIKKRWPDLPIMVLSGHITNQIISEMTKIGFVIFAQKPTSFSKAFFEQLFSALNIPRRPCQEKET